MEDLKKKYKGECIITWCNGKYEIKDKEITMKYLSYLNIVYDKENKNYISVPPQKILKGEHPYGFHSGLKVINNEDEIDGNMVGLYIQCNITKSLPQNAPVHTWRIGAKCKELSRAFMNWKKIPKINNWQVSHISKAVSTFENSYVHLCGHLNFKDVLIATRMFANCQYLEIIPKFGNLQVANEMFENCSSLKNIGKNIKPIYISDASFMFSGCKSLLYGFSHKTFRKYINCRNMYEHCISLINAMNKCTFLRGADFESTFESCVSLQNAFNDCSMNGLIKLERTFATCISMTETFINTPITTIKINRDSFLNCISIIKCFINIKAKVLTGTFYNCPLINETELIFKR